jgi:hypothetical protein
MRGMISNMYTVFGQRVAIYYLNTQLLATEKVNAEKQRTIHAFCQMQNILRQFCLNFSMGWVLLNNKILMCLVGVYV